MIKINPMNQLVKRAERRINLHYMVSPQDLAHDRKRQIARAILAGNAPAQEFFEAARIEGISITDLASLIVAKQDVMMQKENARRALIVRVRAAKAPPEIETILNENNIPEHFNDDLPGLL